MGLFQPIVPIRREGGEIRRSGSPNSVQAAFACEFIAIAVRHDCHAVKGSAHGAGAGAGASAGAGAGAGAGADAAAMFCVRRKVCASSSSSSVCGALKFRMFAHAESRPSLVLAVNMGKV